MLREPEGRYDPLSTCPKCGASGELVETRYCEGGRPRAFSEPELHALTDAVAILSLPPDARLTPAEAWSCVLREVQRVGVYGQPQLPGLVARAVACLGWREICTSDEPDVVRAHFLRVYEQLQARARRDVVLPAALRARLAVSPALPDHSPWLPVPALDA